MLKKILKFIEAINKNKSYINELEQVLLSNKFNIKRRFSIHDYCMLIDSIPSYDERKHALKILCDIQPEFKIILDLFFIKEPCTFNQLKEAYPLGLDKRGHSQMKTFSDFILEMKRFNDDSKYIVKHKAVRYTTCIDDLESCDEKIIKNIIFNDDKVLLPFGPYLTYGLYSEVFLLEEKKNQP